MFNSERAEKFYGHWCELRGARSMPHYRDLFDRLPRDLIPNLVILERASDGGYLARFVGTQVAEMWGQDRTGADIGEILPPPFMAGLTHLLGILHAHPCGASSLAQFQTGHGRVLQTDVVMLPVANDPGRPNRVVIFCTAEPVAHEDSMVASTARKTGRIWLNIGHGTPEAAPPQPD